MFWYNSSSSFSNRNTHIEPFLDRTKASDTRYRTVRSFTPSHSSLCRFAHYSRRRILRRYVGRRRHDRIDRPKRKRRGFPLSYPPLSGKKSKPEFFKFRYIKPIRCYICVNQKYYRLFGFEWFKFQCIRIYFKVLGNIYVTNIISRMMEL